MICIISNYNNIARHSETVVLKAIKAKAETLRICILIL
jgi:hypothetical protein